MGSQGGGCWLPSQFLMIHVGSLLGLQTLKDHSLSCTLTRTVGESVQLPLNSSLGPTIRQIEWNWNSEGEKNQFLVSWKPNTLSHDWYDLEDKYKHRFKVTETFSLSIMNLTTEMSGLYTVEIKFHSGKSHKEAFRLCVYDPIPCPQILIHLSSKTTAWCNLSLECGTPGTTENVTVTWLNTDLLRELEQRESLTKALSSRNLSLSLPLSQLHDDHLTCVVSNPADQKNATLDLGRICSQSGSLLSKWLWKGFLAVFLIMSLGAGVCIWKRRKMNTERGGATLLPAGPASAAAPQTLPTEDCAALQTGGLDSHDAPYAEIRPERHPKNDVDKGSCHAQSPRLTLEVHTVYEKIQKSPRDYLDHDAPGP